MKKYQILYLFALMMAVFGLASCSENDDAVEEFPNWKETNTAYFTSMYNSAKQKIADGDTSWKVIPSYSLNDSVATSPEDYIVVHVVNEGTGSGCPLFTDTTRVHILGHIMPSASYSSGYVFEKSWTGDYDTDVMAPMKLGVNQTVSASSSSSSSTITTPQGLSTALQHMHIGDRWEIYVPYTLGLGDTSYSTTSLTIPGYTTVIYDVTLVAYVHAGMDVPDYK